MLAPPAASASGLAAASAAAMTPPPGAAAAVATLPAPVDVDGVEGAEADRKESRPPGPNVGARDRRGGVSGAPSIVVTPRTRGGVFSSGSYISYS